MFLKKLSLSKTKGKEQQGSHMQVVHCFLICRLNLILYSYRTSQIRINFISWNESANAHSKGSNCFCITFIVVSGSCFHISIFGDVYRHSWDRDGWMVGWMDACVVIFYPLWIPKVTTKGTRDVREINVHSTFGEEAIFLQVRSIWSQSQMIVPPSILSTKYPIPNIRFGRFGYLSISKSENTFRGKAPLASIRHNLRWLKYG